MVNADTVFLCDFGIDSSRSCGVREREGNLDGLVGVIVASSKGCGE